MPPKLLIFEDCIDQINTEINKRKNKWNLTSLAWMDFSDVSQIVRIHLANKWGQYDQTKPLAPWVNRIITNQIRNLIRNNYGNYSRPCLKCAAAEGEDLCSIYSKQCAECPLYANWLKNKKTAYDTKLPLSLENHSQEVYNMSGDSMDIERTAENLHRMMKETLRPSEWRVYKLLYIDNKSEEDVAQIIGFKTTETGKKQGYKRIKQIKVIVIDTARKLLANDEIDIVPQ